MTAVWNRAEAIESVRHRLWLYLTARARPIDIAAIIEDLWRLRRGEVRRLAATHLLLDPVTQAMLDACEYVLKRLPSSVATTEVEMIGAVRGTVSWDRTQQRRWSTGDPTLFVCRPAERRYDTVLGRLVLLGLRRCVELEALAGLAPSGGVGTSVAASVSRARHLRRNPKLLEVLEVHDLPERMLSALSRERDAEPIIRFVRAVRDTIDEMQPERVEEVIAARVLRPAEDDDLFELIVGFGIVDALLARGFREDMTNLIGGSGVPFGSLMKGAGRITIWWQRAVWDFDVAKGKSGHFHETLAAAKMTRSSLRPDFLVMRENPRCLLMVEAKHTERERFSPDRLGIREALAYVYDPESVLITMPEPHALVVAWNSQGVPERSRIVVSNQDTIDQALDIVLGAWDEWWIKQPSRPWTA